MRVINEEIIIHSYEIKDSKFKDSPFCIYIQIEHKGEKKIIFTSSVNIRERLEDYPPKRFPCYATITLDGKAFILN